MRAYGRGTVWRNRRPFRLGCALVLVAGWAAMMCRAQAPTANALALTMHATVVPELHIVPPEERGASASPGDPFSFATGVVCVAGSASSNRASFALHARNLTMLEAVDLVCFLSDTAYGFDGNRLVIAPTNLPMVELKQSATKGKVLIDKLKNTKCPGVELRPPATIIDAFDFMHQVSVDYDEQERLVGRRGINFAVKSPHLLTAKKETGNNVPRMCDLGRPWLTLYDALTNVCEQVNARFVIRDNTVVICPATAH